MNPVAIPDTTGYAPADERWHAVDDDTFDGSPRQLIGYGRTAAAAIEDLRRQIEERAPDAAPIATAVVRRK